LGFLLDNRYPQRSETNKGSKRKTNKIIIRAGPKNGGAKKKRKQPEKAIVTSSPEVPLRDITRLRGKNTPTKGINKTGAAGKGKG